MRFEIGKFYKHTSGKKISIVGCVETTMYGKTLIAEQCDSPDFTPVGYSSDSFAQSWIEIPEDEWMKCFSDD